MRRFAKLRWLGAALLVLAGCRSNDVDVKPAKMAEEYTRPPNDTRYSSNIEYPKETLFTDVIKKDSPAAGAAGAAPSKVGAGMPGRPGF